MEPSSPFPLPREIILSIAALLPLPALGCFALCNRSLEKLLGPSCWGTAPLNARLVRLTREEDGLDRLEFLWLLARDLPQYFVCPHECEILHHRDAVILPNRSNADNVNQLDCISTNSELRSFSHGASAYALESAHIELALKRHTYGEPHGLPLDAFHYDGIVESPYTKHLGSFSAECRIISGELILRHQRWLVIPVLELGESVFNDLCVKSPFDNRRCSYALADIQAKLICRFRDRLYGKDNCDKCTGIFKCRLSSTHFRIDSQSYGEAETAVAVTRWVNTSPYRRMHFPGPALHRRTDWCSKFEAAEGLSIDELTERNMAKLSLERERRRLTAGIQRNIQMKPTNHF